MDWQPIETAPRGQLAGWMPLHEAMRLARVWTDGIDFDNSAQWKAAIKVLADEVAERPAAREPSLAEMEARKDVAYLERNQVVAALAKCFPSGVARTAIEGWSEDWHGCVYIDLPTGQASWHFHDSQAHLFDGLPPYLMPWDGHDTPEKYRRLAALPLKPLTDAARDVLAERNRQVEVLGWTIQHDDEHDSGELAGAGAAYALHAADALHPQSQGDAYRDGSIPHGWCWTDAWWKPAAPRRSLVKAAALILAEIERLDRAGAARQR